MQAAAQVPVGGVQESHADTLTRGSDTTAQRAARPAQVSSPALGALAPCRAAPPGGSRVGASGYAPARRCRMVTAATADRRIRAARMTSLLLDDRPTVDRTVAGVVEWFGAMQGQDFASVMWSLGLRTGSTRDEVGAGLRVGGDPAHLAHAGHAARACPGADARWMIAASRRPCPARRGGPPAVPRAGRGGRRPGRRQSCARPWPAAGR